MKRRAIAVVLDGLRRDMITPNTAPNLAGFAEKATRFAAHRSVFPSATRVASACFATGCEPGRHGLAGNSMALCENGRLMALDCGPPGFMDRMRAVLGRTLAVPTLAQRLSEPDAMLHARPLGSPDTWAALSAADACFGRVREAVDARRAGGEDVLLIACSDHGHQTITEVIDIDAVLIEAGLKQGRDDDTLLAVGNGTAALVYLHADRRADQDAVLNCLRTQPWAGAVLAGDRLADIGHVAADHLLCAISMASDQEANEYGVVGRSYEAMPLDGKDHHLGFGQHGGLAENEQMPFLMIAGADFEAGSERRHRSSPIDIAPTILRHLGHSWHGCDGRPLQDAS